MYVPVSSPTIADQFSRALYLLSRPPSVRDNADITTQLSPYVTNADMSQTYLFIPADVYPINAKALDTTLDTLLDKAVAEGMMQASDKVLAKAAIGANKGKAIQLFNLLPAYLKAGAKTQQQLLDDGFFPTVNPKAL